MNSNERKRLSPKQGHRIYLAALFLVTTVALYFALPQEARFRYEYQKGRPWMHTTLFAPYNFAILKSESEIIHEKDSLLKEQIPYLVYADSVTKLKMVTLSKDIDRLKPSKANGSLQLTALKLKLTEMYNQIYEIGILDQNFINTSNSSKKKSLKILKNNIGKETKITSLFSLKSAYNEIKDKLDELKSVYPEWSSWLENFQPETYLVSNLILDCLLYTSDAADE